MINGHGDDIYSLGSKIVSNFSSNVYTKLDSSKLERYLCDNISSIHSYPEPDAYSLSQLIAEISDVQPENICITNGAIEAIYLIAQAFRKSRSSILIPTFSEYEDACRIHEHELHFARSVDEIEQNTDLVWMCNPNNPTGKIYDIDSIRNLIESNPEKIFIIDHSYIAFSDKPFIAIEEATNYKNLILLHSLTKCYAIPGLRLGYFTACKELVDKIRSYSMPWSVNQLAQLAGKYLLENVSYDYTDYLKESQRVQDEMKKIEGLTIYPSDMHFFLCELKKEKSSELKIFLAEKYGFLIRDASNFRGLNDAYFRIAVQSKNENNLLIDNISEWVKLSY
ncbi:MAG: aminotransferase class I/II-fold pyridoxal phosphate-dependent enzyme [Dysgonomonas sp.]|nr:aminotransferase class I/II-fold pyridoxal phosphate-dependent enzyme [Dysgonomonas sp.]